MDNGRLEYKFLWSIENYSYCWHKNGEALYSRKFTIAGLERTIWCLVLYPRGCGMRDEGNISLLLYRFENDGDQGLIPLNFTLSFLATNGSVLHSKDFKFIFKKKSMQGSLQFLQTDEIHGQRKSEYLPNDTLTVCCKMWNGEGNVGKACEICARTRIGIEKISFLHGMESFSTQQPNDKKTIQIRCYSERERTISSSLYITDGAWWHYNIKIEIVPSYTKLILQKCELYLIAKSGNLVECGGTDFGCEYTDGPIFKLPLSLKRHDILSRKSEYLPEDKLSLMCKCIFSTGNLSESFEEIPHEIPLTVLNQNLNQVLSKVECKAAKMLSEYPSLSEDIKAVYISQHLTDVELKTKSKSFPAHKIVLCARSPVFDAMLKSDMEDKNTKSIHVDDLENDTVQQLLLFLYSDNIENLQWESATQLYYASDKYRIEKLKALCSLFLAENLSSSNASDLLLLADTHNDSSLKIMVEDFILQNEEQVFGSREWEKLIETNPQLVIKTMHLKYKR